MNTITVTKINSLLACQLAVANEFGDCEATYAVSRNVLAQLRAGWIKSKPKPTPKPKKFFNDFRDMLMDLDFRKKVQVAFSNGNTTNKIGAIKFVRFEVESHKWERMGLKDAKDYVEWVCCGYPMPTFLY